MSYSTRFRRLLLSATAAAYPWSAAHAEDLSALKAQLEALQLRVDTLQSREPPAPVHGSHVIRVEQGSSGTGRSDGAKADRLDENSARGVTFSVIPAADMPVPVAEITVYGYAAVDVIWDSDDRSFTRSFSRVGLQLPGAGPNDQTTLHANRSRFGIKSSVDTPAGRIRTRIEADFEGSPFGANSSLRLRHAHGKWDFAPNWTLTVGQDWHIAGLDGVGPSTVDFAGPLVNFSRNEQLRLEYQKDGFSVGLGIEDPSFRTNTALPNLAGYVRYKSDAGHVFIVTGEIADWDNPSVASAINDGLGWVVQAGMDIAVTAAVRFSAAGIYGAGLPSKFCLSGNLVTPTHTATGSPFESFCTLLGLSLDYGSGVSFNAIWSYGDTVDDVSGVAGLFTDDYHSIHANVIWKPVSRMKMGWEVIYANLDSNAGGRVDTVRAQFGTWFFF